MTEVVGWTQQLIDKIRAANRAASSAGKQVKLSEELLVLKSDSEYERLLDEADRRPRYRTRIRQADLDARHPARLSVVACQGMPFIAEAEGAIGRDLFARGQSREAADRMLRLLRITRKWIASEPFFTSHNLAVSIRASCYLRLNEILGAGFPTELHDEIEKELSLHDHVTKDSALAANGVREMHLDRNRMIAVHRYSWMKPLALIDEASVHQEINDYVRSVDESFATYSERTKPRHPLGGLPTTWFGSSASEGLKRARKHFDESIARARCLRIINMMAKRKNFKADLDSLGLPKECSVDPMNGKRLRIKRTSDGPIVYSVGGDLNDDGGKIDAFQPPYDVGFGPPKATKK